MNIPEHLCDKKNAQSRTAERGGWREKEGARGTDALMAESEDLKQLRIRSGVVKRLRKELAAYSSECEREQEKVEKMRADGADAHDIKQQVRRGPLTHAHWRQGASSAGLG